MSVRELIDRLTAMPPDAAVLLRGDDFTAREVAVEIEHEDGEHIIWAPDRDWLEPDRVYGLEIR